LVIIDAVDWSPAYPDPHPLRNVGEWFARHLRGDPAVEIIVVHASGAVEEAMRAPNVVGVLLSGSPRDAWAPDPVNNRLSKVILDCERRRLPFLGVCYGHQLLGVALGAQVAREPAGVELGNVSISLTDAGRADPLFEGVPPEFEALQSHQDSVLSLPAGAELLAVGAHTRIQSFRYGECLRGVQFHPEHDPDILRFIWEPRRTGWRDRCSFNIDERLNGLRPAPFGPKILKNFMNLCRRRVA
jgi:GMP synthase (glutamine-hydrolysing)